MPSISPNNVATSLPNLIDGVPMYKRIKQQFNLGVLLGESTDCWYDYKIIHTPITFRTNDVENPFCLNKKMMKLIQVFSNQSFDEYE